MGTIFIGPDGVEVRDADFHRVRSLILEVGNDYWQANAGDATVTKDDVSSSWLHIMVKDPHGVFLLHISPGGRFTACNDERARGAVTMYPGGEPLRLERRFFIPRAMAWPVVDEFIHSGTRSSSVRWVELSYDDPP